MGLEPTFSFELGVMSPRWNQLQSTPRFVAMKGLEPLTPPVPQEYWETAECSNQLSYIATHGFYYVIIPIGNVIFR